jgi:hypothetical protein
VVDRHTEAVVDVLAAQEPAEQGLAVWQPADAEVPEERLGRNIRELDLGLEAGLAQPVGHVEQELVGRAEATRTLRCRDDDVAGVLQQAAPPLTGPHGILERGDRDGVVDQARHGIHLVAITGRHHEVVVVVPGSAGGAHPLAIDVDLDRRRVHEVDAVLLEGRRDRERDVLGIALAERQPDQARVEHEPVGRGKHPHIHVTAQLPLHRQGRGEPAEIGTQHEHLLAHRIPLSFMGTVCRRVRVCLPPKVPNLMTKILA